MYIHKLRICIVIKKIHWNPQKTKFYLKIERQNFHLITKNRAKNSILAFNEFHATCVQYSKTVICKAFRGSACSKWIGTGRRAWIFATNGSKNLNLLNSQSWCVQCMCEFSFTRPNAHEDTSTCIQLTVNISTLSTTVEPQKLTNACFLGQSGNLLRELRISWVSIRIINRNKKLLSSANGSLWHSVAWIF